jgi:Ala-tRNA(Pro) deacylase
MIAQLRGTQPEGTEMNEIAFDEIRQLLDVNEITYNLLSHEICRTSSQSAEARASAGFPSIGAKALVTKLSLVAGGVEYATIVLPGPSRLDSRKLKAQMPDLKRFRFVTEAELFSLCGVPTGAMPPFGNKIFPGIAKLFVDGRLSQHEEIGFNAADLTRSIVMRSEDYLRVAEPTMIVDIAG